MWLNILCNICNIRKRVILKAMPDNDLHANLETKITWAMNNRRDVLLGKEEFEYICKLMDISTSVVKLYDEKVGARCHYLNY